MKCKKYYDDRDITAPGIESRKLDIAGDQKEIQTRTAFRTTLVSEREKEAANFEQLVAEHRMVREMIVKAKGIMSTLKNESEGEEFLQLDSSSSAFGQLNSVLAEFAPLVENGPAHFYGNVFILLAKMAERAAQNKSDQSLVDNILAILDKLADNVENSLDIEKKAEAEREEIYDFILNRVDGDLKRLNRKTSGTEQEIVNMQGNLDFCQENIDFYELTMEENSQQVIDVRVQCTGMKTAYESFDKNV